MDDRDILSLYIKRDEQAVSETERAYGSYSFAIANNILRGHADAEEVVADSLMKLWCSIPPQKPKSLKLYLARVTRNLALSKWRSLSAQKRGGGQVLVALEELGDCVSDDDDVEALMDKKELGSCISRFLQSQTARDRALFLRRYFHMEDTAHLAREFRLKEANVLQILSRTRRRLKDYLIKEGYSL